MFRIGQLKTVRIGKRLHRFGKYNPVFLEILDFFRQIPFEFHKINIPYPYVSLHIVHVKSPYWMQILSHIEIADEARQSPASDSRHSPFLKMSLHGHTHLRVDVAVGTDAFEGRFSEGFST